MLRNDTSVSVENIEKAYENLKPIVTATPLMYSENISQYHHAKVYLKREDLQIVRSYKLRGAYNKISSIPKEDHHKGIVCASAGNHAQGVAYSCHKLGIKGSIFMPVTTPLQKINKVRMFGKNLVDVILTGDSFDEANAAAEEFHKKTGGIFIHPFDDVKVIEGQGTVGLEIVKDAQFPIDYLFFPIGGGGLAAGVSSYFKRYSPNTKLIGVEPAGAAGMKASITAGKVVRLEKIDKFVDGAAVEKVGDLTYSICKNLIDDIIEVPEGKVCSTILRLYNEDAIVVEPTGALALSALDFYEEKIKDKNVVCIISGSNNDIIRFEDIKERSLLFEGLKHYFIIRFPQRAGALRDFLVNALGPNDDITHFEYSKKNNREQGPAVIGIELRDKNDLKGLLERMQEQKIKYEYLNDNSDLFQYLI